MSRDDTYFGDNHSFQPKIFDAFMNIAAPDNAKTVTIAGAAAARWSRVVACNATNPQFQYSKKQVALYAVLSYLPPFQLLIAIYQFVWRNRPFHLHAGPPSTREPACRLCEGPVRKRTTAISRRLAADAR